MYQHTETTYQCGVLSVDNVRSISLTHKGEPVTIDVEVESRPTRMESHAGIFTRFGNTNVKMGSTLPAEAQTIGLSADDILMEVGWSLLAISILEENSFENSM